MSAEIVDFSDAMDRLRDTNREIGTLQLMSAQGAAGIVFIVPGVYAHDVLRLLIDRGLSLSNDAALGAMVARVTPLTAPRTDEATP